MHLRMSPGGRMPNSSRSRPVLPPLSTIDTTAVMSMSGMSRNPTAAQTGRCRRLSSEFCGFRGHNEKCYGFGWLVVSVGC